jgi:hypothetical protein
MGRLATGRASGSCAETVRNKRKRRAGARTLQPAKSAAVLEIAVVNSIPHNSGQAVLFAIAMPRFSPSKTRFAGFC